MGHPEAATRLTLRLAAKGCKLTSLLPQHVRHWWPLVEDIFFSDSVQGLFDKCLLKAVAHTEFECVGIDATLKCCLSVLGQASYKASAEDRASAAFTGNDAFRKVLRI